MGISYYVTDKEDRWIMTAPMFTLYRAFNLAPSAVERIEKETHRLTDKCILVFRTKEEGQRDWDVLQIRRMPTEIPGLIEDRCRVWKHPGTSPIGFRCLLEDGHAGEHSFKEVP